MTKKKKIIVIGKPSYFYKRILKFVKFCDEKDILPDEKTINKFFKPADSKFKTAMLLYVFHYFEKKENRPSSRKVYNKNVNNVLNNLLPKALAEKKRIKRRERGDINENELFVSMLPISDKEKADLLSRTKERAINSRPELN